MPNSDNATGQSLLDRARILGLNLLDVVPGARRMASEFARVEVIDRSLIIAAQTLFSVTPLLVVLAAFAPHAFSSGVLDQVTDLLGLDEEDAAPIDAAATAETVRAQTGLIGTLLVIVSALSFARAFQRLYERVWEKSHRGGIVGNRRCLWWLISWLIYVQLVAWVVTSIRGTELEVVRIVVQIGVSTVLWWWTAHTLMLGRVEWRSLFPGALLTAIGMHIAARVSHVVMPAYVQATIDQFGGIGLMLAASTWLLCIGAVIVVASILGRVLHEEPRLALPSFFSRRSSGR